MKTTPRREAEELWGQLYEERQPWMETWREIGSNCFPARGQWLRTDADRPCKTNADLLNSEPIWAAQVFQAGLMAGIASPARPWAALTVPDPELAKDAEIADWCHDATETVLKVFEESDFYNAMAEAFFDIAFGQAVMLLEEHARRVLHASVVPCGQYVLATNDEGEVDTFGREFTYRVSQCVRAFGYQSCSPTVRAAWDRRNYRAPVHVVQMVMPRMEDFVDGQLDERGMRWRSVWFETGSPQDTVLREKGYREFPACTPRWSVRGTETYGYGPGWATLPDCKSLQLFEKRSLEAADKSVRPAMQGPALLQGGRASLVPGDTNWLPASAAGQKFEPMHVVDPRAIEMMDRKGLSAEQRIRKGFLVDLFLMFAGDGRSQPPTAEEVRAKSAEKSLQIGPAFERLQHELLTPAVSRGFRIAWRAGLIRPPPALLQRAGLPVRVEFTSILAQAQKAVGTAAVERTVGFLGNISGAYPAAADLLDVDKTVRNYARQMGAPPDMLHTEEEVAVLRQRRAAAAAQAAQQQQAMAAVEAAKNLSQADTTGDNGLTRVLGALGPAAAAGAGSPAGGIGGLP